MVGHSSSQQLYNQSFFSSHQYQVLVARACYHCFLIDGNSALLLKKGDLSYLSLISQQLSFEQRTSFVRPFVSVNLSIQVLVESLLLTYHNCDQLLFDQPYFETFVIDNGCNQTVILAVHRLNFSRLCQHYRQMQVSNLSISASTSLRQ